MTIAYFPWTQLTAIAIRGKDRVKWLNNLTTNDIRRVEEQGSVECFATDVKGRTLAHGVVSSCDDDLVFVSWGRDQAERLIKHWDRYIIREDVVLEEITSVFQWILIGSSSTVASQSEVSLATLDRDGIDGCQRSFPALGPSWSWVRIDGSISLPTYVVDHLSQYRQLEEREVECLRIVHRWPIVGVDFDEKNLPQELDRNATSISFTKGCYLGQETVARLDALGQVQKKLVRLSLAVNDDEISFANTASALVASGEKIFQGDQEVGWVTSCVRHADERRWNLLAYVKRACFEIGTVLIVGGRPAIIESDLTA